MAERTVLLVEDEKQLRIAAGAVLELNGYRVWRSLRDGLPGAESVSDAMAIISREGRPPDALVTDWWMGGEGKRSSGNKKRSGGNEMLRLTSQYYMVRIVWSWEANRVIAEAIRAAGGDKSVVPAQKTDSLLYFILNEEFAHPERWQAPPSK